MILIRVDKPNFFFCDKNIRSLLQSTLIVMFDAICYCRIIYLSKFLIFALDKHTVKLQK